LPEVPDVKQDLVEEPWPAASELWQQILSGASGPSPQQSPSGRTVSGSEYGNRAAQAYVFVSYSSKDWEYTARLVEHLRTADIRVWWGGDRPSDIGRAVAATHAVDSCGALVSVWTRDAFASDRVRREIEQAAAAGRPVLPLSLQRTEVPDPFARYGWTDVHDNAMPGPMWITQLKEILTGNQDMVPRSLPAAQSSDPLSLATYLGLDAATALIRWSAETGRQVSVPSWSSSSDELRWLLVSRKGEEAVPVVASVRAATGGAQLTRYQQARVEAPNVFVRHLATSAFSPLRLNHDQNLFLERLGGGEDLQWHRLSELSMDSTRVVCVAVIQSLLQDWNPQPTPRPVGVQSYLSDRLLASYTTAKLAQIRGIPQSRWIRIGSEILPNPLDLPFRQSILHDPRLQVLVGRTHGDLHVGNVLVPMVDDRPEPGLFRLVDLSTYDAHQSLGTDLVRLLTSVIALKFDELSAAERRELALATVNPDQVRPEQTKPLVDMVRAMYESAEGSMRPSGGGDVWRQQYLLDLMRQSLDISTDEHSPSERRWWFFQVAGHAARRLLGMLRPTVRPPDAAPVVANPFGDGTYDGLTAVPY
jgi:hypothetical protein